MNFPLWKWKSLKPIKSRLQTIFGSTTPVISWSRSLHIIEPEHLAELLVSGQIEHIQGRDAAKERHPSSEEHRGSLLAGHGRDAVQHAAIVPPQLLAGLEASRGTA